MRVGKDGNLSGASLKVLRMMQEVDPDGKRDDDRNQQPGEENFDPWPNGFMEFSATEYLKKENDRANVMDQDLPSFLDPQHLNHSAKLAAAIAAWRAVTDDPKLTRAKSVKSALQDWLTAHAKDLHLTKKDGTVNNQAMEEIAKVANWDPKGGAPKTPGN